MKRMMSLPANNDQSLEFFMKATLSFDITPDDGIDFDSSI